MVAAESETVPVFADTSALYARVDEDDVHHDAARDFFDGIRTGDLPYRPLFVTSHVLGELATLATIRLDVATARTTIERLQASELVTVVHPGADTFTSASAAFTSGGDEVALVDHVTAVAADDRDVDHVFAFDGDFRTLGLTLVPKVDETDGS